MKATAEYRKRTVWTNFDSAQAESLIYAVGGNTLVLKNLTYIEATRSIGAPDRTILLRHINSSPKMTVQKISTQPTERADQAAVVAEIFSVERADRAMQEVMSRLNIEPSVKSVRWEKG